MLCHAGHLSLFILRNDDHGDCYDLYEQGNILRNRTPKDVVTESP